ncbi:methyltransferase domain-containing protein [Candidatus Pelagibacter sp. Uisw_116]|uniref:class I SAM-dependent methyltransferase n=1 Tax=Candidatus Pelagibacter sp. Uisw_116 TaxID=3230986 RepID=UPI0039E84CA3
MKKLTIDEGSFRDPDARVAYLNNSVYRIVYPNGFKKFDFIKRILKNKSIAEYLIDTEEVSQQEVELLELDIDTNVKVFKHKKIDYISYPYEWSFYRLKDAALHHLNLHISLLKNNATLIDAYSYNVQFNNYSPIFIDLMSIKEYSEGEFWTGHKQFCESFLNPLVLKSKLGINYNNWFKGNLEGIDTGELSKLLKFRHMFSWNIFYNILLLNYFEKKYKKNEDLKITKNKKLKKSYYLSILTNLVNFIESLKPKKETSVWGEYSRDNTYNDEEKKNKYEFISNYFNKNKSNRVLDLGCNNGEYSKLAIQSGCKSVVGLDYDLNAIDEAYWISKKERLNFLPLYFDVSNPSSDIGWHQKERKGFMKRLNFDFVLALAFEHHLAIAKNIPLEDVINWITSLAPKGIIEFVPKNDVTIQSMIKLKGDIFPNYNLENFKNFLSKKTKITSEKIVSKSGRTLFSFEK